jgi:hypothetical protein
MILGRSIYSFIHSILFCKHFCNYRETGLLLTPMCNIDKEVKIGQRGYF